MRIIHIDDFFHPDAGYQENILSKLMSSRGHEVFVITTEIESAPKHLTSFFGIEDTKKKDLVFYQNTGVRIIRCPVHCWVSQRAIYKDKLFRIVEELHPDILYIHSNESYVAIKYLLRYKKLKFPIVMDSHMLEMASVNKAAKLYRKIYKARITPVIIKNSLTIIRIQDDNYLEKHLGIPIGQCPWISVGSDTSIFKSSQENRQKFRKENGIRTEDFVIIYAGKLDEFKGGTFLAETLKKRINTRKRIVFLLVGSTTGEYSSLIEKEFSQSENEILRFPTQKYVELDKFYQASDLAIFPKQCSLSFYDVQACGLPVLAENNNINRDRMENNNGWLFEIDSIDDFREKMVALVEMDECEFLKMKNSAIKFIEEKYDYIAITDQYLDAICEEIKKFDFKTQ